MARLAVPRSDASPDDGAPRGYGWYRNEGDGYELIVYDGWNVEYDRERPGVAHFTEEKPDDSQPPLRISIGSRDGEVNICALACFAEVVHSIDELEDAIQQTWPFESVGERVESTTLGGEPARFRSATAPVHVLHPHFVCVAYAFHDDRPVVVSYGCDAHPNGLADMPEYAAILASFRFLDVAPAEPSPPASEWRVIAVTGTRLSIATPTSWEVTTVLAHRTIVAGPEGSVSVRHYETGELDLCPPIGPCGSFTATSVEDLVSYVAREYRLDYGLARVETNAEPAILRAGEALRMTVRPGGNRIFPASRGAIVAVLGSQSLIVQWSGSLAPPSPLEEILASIRVAD